MCHNNRYVLFFLSFNILYDFLIIPPSLSPSIPPYEFLYIYPCSTKNPILMDPETNPRMAPYAMQAKMKPTVVTFGHRPRSANLTFHPATMRIRYVLYLIVLYCIVYIYVDMKI